MAKIIVDVHIIMFIAMEDAIDSLNRNKNTLKNRNIFFCE